jgi:probable phosphoglycerate mutase
MKIHLIRHGETASSGKTYAGRSDVPLSESGHGQARRIARDLSGHPIALILSSPLSRAVDTARPLAASFGLDPIKEPALMEIDFGVYEGHPKDALGPKLRKTHAVTPIPGGESLMDVWARAGRVLEFLETFHLPPTSQIALFGHFWINRLLHGRACGMEFEEACRSRIYRPKTGSVLTIRLRRPFQSDFDAHRHRCDEANSPKHT